MADEPQTGETQSLVRVRGLSKSYQQGHALSRRRFQVRALDSIDLNIPPGSIFALVGESGSGKSTLARCLAHLEPPSAGQVWFDGEDLLAMRGARLFHLRREIQLVFQETSNSLSPRFSAEEIIAEPLRIQKEGDAESRKQRVGQLMEEVGLRKEWAQRRPHQFSGGQRQRIAIARALSLKPRLLILDEALAGLDLPAQQQILQLLAELQRCHSLTYVLISHDLALVAGIAARTAVLHRGRVVEQGDTAELMAAPRHPQTQALARAIPGARLRAARRRV